MEADTETLIDMFTLALALGSPTLVLAVLRPWRNWHDRPYAVENLLLAGYLAWSAIAGIGVVQTWDTHVRIALIALLPLQTIVLVYFRRRKPWK